MNPDKISKPEELETERLRLFPAGEEHKDAIHSILKNPRVRNSIRSEVLDTADKYDQWWQRRVNLCKDGSMLQWCVYKKDDGSFCALLTLKEISENNSRAELGYSLLPEYWGIGVGTEAVGSVMRYAFDKIELHTLFAQVLEINVKSKKLIDKLGFIQEGCFKDSYFYEGEYYDLVQFAKTNPQHLL